MEPKQLTCQSCSAEFSFTAEEQEFYAAKGFQEPKRCKTCRDAAKAEKQNRGGGYGGGGYGGGRGGYGGGGGYRQERQLFDVVCSACGSPTQVPFQPNGSKPVYCRTCFQENKSFSY